MALANSTGTTLECLQEFSISNGFKDVSRADGPRRNRLCVILGVSEITGRRWFDKFEVPIGVNLIRLQIFLEFLGYSITERMITSKFGRRLCEYLVFGDETPRLFGTRIKVHEKTILDWTTTQMPAEATLAAVEEILQTAEPQIDAAKRAWSDLLTPLNLRAAPTKKVNQAVQATKSSSAFVVGVLRAMEHLVVDIGKITSSEFSPTDREIFLRSNAAEQLTQAVDKLNLTAMKDGTITT